MLTAFLHNIFDDENKAIFLKAKGNLLYLAVFKKRSIQKLFAKKLNLLSINPIDLTVFTLNYFVILKIKQLCFVIFDIKPNIFPTLCNDDMPLGFKLFFLRLTTSRIFCVKLATRL